MDPGTLLLAIAILIFAVGAMAALMKSIRIYKEHERGVRFRLGRLNKVTGPGLSFSFPFLDSTVPVDTRSRLVQIPELKALTAENASVFLDIVARYRISSPSTAVMKSTDPGASFRIAVETAVRGLAGELSFAELVKKREFINAKLRESVALRAEGLGITAEGVEITDITPSERTLELMNKSMRSKRKKAK